MPAGGLPGQDFVLATDLDGTLVGDAGALTRLNSWISGQGKRVKLVYLTGRHLASALQLIASEGLLEPDILVHDVGAGIRLAPFLAEDSDWDGRVRRDWNYMAVHRLLAGMPELENQRIPTNLRLSFFTAGPPWKAAARVEPALRGAGISARVVASGRNLLDILPSGAGKGAALAYLRRSRLGSTTRILVCGDSGNDLDMLTLGLPAVVVSNASPEVRAAALPPTVYQAQAPYAGGILEAIDHYQFGGTGPSPL